MEIDAYPWISMEFMDIDVFHQISIEFFGFHGFRGSPCMSIYGFQSISMHFYRCHGFRWFPCVSMDFNKNHQRFIEHNLFIVNPWRSSGPGGWLLESANLFGWRSSRCGAWNRRVALQAAGGALTPKYSSLPMRDEQFTGSAYAAELRLEMHGNPNKRNIGSLGSWRGSMG